MAKRTCFFSFNFISLFNSLHLFTDAFVFTSFSCCFCVVLFPCPFHTRCFFSHSVGTLTHTQQFELYFTFQFLFTLGSLFRHYKFNAILSFLRPPFHSFSFAISHSCNVHSIQFDSANDGGDGDNDNDKNNNDTMATKRMPLFTVSTEMYENSLGKSEVKYRNLQRNDFIVEKEIF